MSNKKSKAPKASKAPAKAKASVKSAPARRPPSKAGKPALMYRKQEPMVRYPLRRVRTRVATLVATHGGSRKRSSRHPTRLPTVIAPLTQEVRNASAPGINPLRQHG